MTFQYAIQNRALEQALNILKKLSSNDLVLTIQYNTDDEWFDAKIMEAGDNREVLADISGEGNLIEALIGLAEIVDTD